MTRDRSLHVFGDNDTKTRNVKTDRINKLIWSVEGRLGDHYTPWVKKKEKKVLLYNIA